MKHKFTLLEFAAPEGYRWVKVGEKLDEKFFWYQENKELRTCESYRMIGETNGAYYPIFYNYGRYPNDNFNWCGWITKK
jgi:hypothetical protein